MLNDTYMKNFMTNINEKCNQIQIILFLVAEQNRVH